ncbi:MAG: hypothetical protein WC028_23300 [Candidatus Obscuribacterales bacterium]
MSEFPGQDQDNNHDKKDQGLEADPKKARVRKLSQTQELKAITLDPRASNESRELARQVQEMRDNSKALGIPTDILDQFANNALSDEIQATKERQATEPGLNQPE